ncbi:hypothetical protein SO802_003001 [Lithocarpus litseifolius]|uniref:Uncharacterized protein n=1 Tax=Lithocarpus litseifolius TaxID=425828 RepID=A0AAW2E1G7_9ROSI
MTCGYLRHRRWARWSLRYRLVRYFLFRPPLQLLSGLVARLSFLHFPFSSSKVRGSGLNIALGELFPVLSQSINWFENLVGERVRMSKVRSSDLEIGLSSSSDPVEGDTIISTFWEVRDFHTLDEVCGLDGDILAVKRRPKLKSRYKELVEKAIEYAKTIEDFDDLVDPWTLAFYYLGPNLSAFVLRTLGIEEKKRMKTKFNQSMYARMRAKKNEPLSSLRAKTVRVMDKGASITPATPVTPGVKTARTASPATSVEEVQPQRKRQRNDKAVSRVVVVRAQETFTAEEMKVFSVARVAALEAENSKLKNDLITSMNEANVVKENAKSLKDNLGTERQLTLEKDEQLSVAKEKIKTVAAKAIEAFQQTDEYNTVLFSWYFKGFELLRRYLVKHPSGVDLDSLDLEEVDKEMIADETSHSLAPEGDAPKSALPPSVGDDTVTT